MTVSLSLSIMACPPRAKHATLLAERLEAQATLARSEGFTVFAPVVSVDTEMRGCGFGASRAWALAGAATHHLVVQDDVLTCRDFVQAVMRILVATPVAAHSFYLAKHYKAPDDLPQPSQWLSTKCIGSLAVALPTPVAREVGELLLRSPKAMDDEFLGPFVRARYGHLRVSCPSLVQHMEIPSLLRHDALYDMLRGQHFVGEDADARHLPWHDAPTYGGT